MHNQSAQDTNWTYIKESDSQCIEHSIWSDDTHSLFDHHRIFGLYKSNLNKSFHFRRIFDGGHSVWFCQRGAMQFKTAFSNYSIKNDDIVIIPDSVACDITCSRANTQCIIVDFGIHSRWGALEGSDIKSLKSQDMPRLNTLIDHLNTEIFSNNSSRDTMNQLLIDQLAILLERELRDPSFVAHSDQRQKLIELFSEVQSKLQYAWTMHELANKIHISEPHFFRLCKQHLGESPKRRLNRMRMTAAKNMLSHSQKNIKQIASEVGFSNPLNFSTAFKKSCTLAPRDYRTLHGLVKDGPNTH
ncbi:MAG: helix-turn-helix transcriptional regulator [Planctomycetes bacterium]|nr:helix-turn-helix transcriptional regulator [Planctomycetota bacterium]